MPEPGHVQFCYAKPQGDLAIESPEVTGISDIPIKTLSCCVEGIEKLHDVGTQKLPASNVCSIQPVSTSTP